MKRRDFLVLVGTAPVAAVAQAQQGRVYRVALVFTTSHPSEMEGPEPLHPSARAFVRHLRELGYREGTNLFIDRQTAEGQLEKLPSIIAALVQRNTDIIVAVGHPSIVPAIKLAGTIPVILVPSYFDPVQAGLVESLGRPGKNVTGLTITASPEIEAKRLELLGAMLPGAGRRIAFLGMKQDWEDAYGQNLRGAAGKLGINLVPTLHEPADYGFAFEAIKGERAHAVLVANTPVNFANRDVIVQFVTANRLPAAFSRREYVQAGGLLSYGVDITALFSRAGEFVDKILKGTRPSELPVEQPTKFELLVNRRAATALSVAIPPTLLATADEVID